jgi:hypothetical protein
MTLNQLVYEQILFAERIANYKLYDEFWHVVKYNDQTNIHFTMKRVSHSQKIYWYLAATSYSPKFRCQTQEFTLWSNIGISNPSLQAGK